ncbi:putative vacuolar protein sorting-associated protein TDA6 [Eurytemora carolleeae]|uniref:putative vacuolar protein sorting-associated protein TDA6 n=1 Tax=Eurytemora carolleeae TaxID=1294199 RepID=UPI000C78367B|nr:putative vacuolar protein sorting-associated protein TDA6 [Eurytemora carolleeae]|eukprot:XP_023337870.1 putative vacuolar protein sorting-associated protein TDA6 [Eurytemora affinis]
MIFRIFICIFILDFKQVHSLSEEARKLVEKWAPLVWIHSEDPFMPSSVPFHLQNIQINDENERLVQENPTQDSIVTGPDTDIMHMNTKYPVDCVNCFQPFFFGEDPSTAPMYTFVTEHLDSCSTVDVTYSMFYPYNYGKDVCVGLEEFGFCVGDWQTFGNHIGDWEHVSLRFQGGEPLMIYVGVHSFGAWYSWDRSANRFVFSHGEPLKKKTIRNGKTLEMRIDVDYPEFLDLEEGRPAVFSANGSHGVWAQPGKHTYLHILTVHLDDFCDKGVSWKSWENLKIYETGPLDQYTGEDSWINFKGRWGNIKKLGCGLEPLIGECGLVGGPTGPHKYFKHDFQQPPACIPPRFHL